MKKVFVALFSVLTLVFGILTIQRWTLDYNENGVAFDGEVTYDTDAVVVYGLITLTLFLVTLAIHFLWKQPEKNSVMTSSQKRRS